MSNGNTTLRDMMSRDNVQVITSKKNMKEVIERTGGEVTTDTIKDERGRAEMMSNGEELASFDELASLAAGSKIFIKNGVAGLSRYLFGE